MTSSSGFGVAASAVMPASRRFGQHNYERVVPVATAGMYDWKITNYSNQPILAGGHNAFPRRLPSAGSDRLRQMYLKTDTVSGRLVLSSAQERSRQKRLRVLQRTIDQQTKELEERNRDIAVAPSSSPPEAPSEPSSRPPSQLDSQLLAPPIRSLRGMTIIKESRRLQSQRVSGQPSEDESNNTAVTTDKVHAEMSIYLPRADITEDSYTAPLNTSRSENMASYSSKANVRSRHTHTAHPVSKYSQSSRAVIHNDRMSTGLYSRYSDITDPTQQHGRPSTAN